MAGKSFIWDFSSNEKYGSRIKKRGLIPHYCEVCGYAITPPTKHRINPGRDGGKYVPGNVIGVCPSCHNQCDRGLIPSMVLFSIVHARLQREARVKQCWACERCKSLQDFADEPEAEDGKHSECRDCMSGFKISGFLDGTTKICSICLKPKSLEDFSVFPFTRDHHRPECSSCLTIIAEATDHYARDVAISTVP